MPRRRSVKGKATSHKLQSIHNLQPTIAVIDNHVSRTRTIDGGMSREAARLVALIEAAALTAPLKVNIRVVHGHTGIQAVVSSRTGPDHPAGFICSGSELDVDSSGREARDILEANLAVVRLFPSTPKLLVCYAFQVIPHFLFGWPAKRMTRRLSGVHKARLIGNPEAGEFDIFLNHAYYLDTAEKPRGFDVLAQSHQGVCQTYVNRKENLIGLQFHPERHASTECIIADFVHRCLGLD